MVARVRVATYNLYLGADQLQATAFPRRADALAAALLRRGRAPDLVGLQEVCLWRAG